MSKILLRSSDDEDFEIEVTVAQLSGTIKNMLEHCNLEDSQNVIPLPNVNSKILEQVIAWAKHHYCETQKPKDDQDQDDSSEDNFEWEKEFLHVNKELMIELITAADYLDIKALSKLTTKGVANMIQGKSTEEICQAFNIVRICGSSTDKSDDDVDIYIGDMFPD